MGMELGPVPGPQPHLCLASLPEAWQHHACMLSCKVLLCQFWEQQPAHAWPEQRVLLGQSRGSMLYCLLTGSNLVPLGP